MEFGRSAGLDRACRTTEEVVQGPLALARASAGRSRCSCDLAYGAGMAKALKLDHPGDHRLQDTSATDATLTRRNAWLSILPHYGHDRQCHSADYRRGRSRGRCVGRCLCSNPSSYASFLAASRLIRRGRCRWRGRYQQVRLRRFDSANRPCSVPCNRHATVGQPMSRLFKLSTLLLMFHVAAVAADEPALFQLVRSDEN